MTEVEEEWVEGTEGDFPVPTAVLPLLPKGSTVVGGEKSGISAWSKTAKITVRLDNGDEERYFFKSTTGQGARPLALGEYETALIINKAVPNFSPKATGWGEYKDGTDKYYFYLGAFHDMDLSQAPDPVEFSKKVAMLHSKCISPNGKFGFGMTTVVGKLERTVTWESTWAASFTHLLKDAMGYDNKTNGVWPELDKGCRHLIERVIPRLLGALQSDGRSITPSLIHANLWENNVGIDMETGEIVIFDLGAIYGHNEFEFGTWRCTWASHFSSPAYMLHYQRYIQPSEPVEEFDDRNRLYSIHPYLIDSAGHPGSYSRRIAFNDILYLCEKYAPIDGIGSYNPDEDISVTGRRVPFVKKPLG